MAESMQGLHRTCRCAEVTKEMIGKEVVLMGWVQKARDKGGIIFVDLRDRSGIMHAQPAQSCRAPTFPLVPAANGGRGSHVHCRMGADVRRRRVGFGDGVPRRAAD